MPCLATAAPAPAISAAAVEILKVPVVAARADVSSRSRWTKRHDALA